MSNWFLKGIVVAVGVILLISLLVGSVYLLAIGVTKMAILGASYFEGDFKTFFLVWFGLATLSIFYVTRHSEVQLNA